MQTLNEFFNTQPNSLDWASQVTGQGGFDQARPLIARELAGIEIPPAFYEMLILKLCEAMDLKIGNLLVAGYRKRREIVSFRDKPNPSEGYHTVTLLEHTLTSKHAPTIKPMVNQVPIATLTFHIILKLTLGGGELHIKDGTIFEASTGTVTGGGAVDFEGIPLLEKRTAAIDLPGTLTFDPAIPI